MVDQKCRVCLKKGSFDSIFRVNGSIMLSSMIMSLANVQISPDDGLPSTLCLTCTKKLENCIKFVEQCKKSDHILRSTLISNEKSHGNIKKDYDVENNVPEDNYLYNSDVGNEYSPKNSITSVDERLIDNACVKKDNVQSGSNSDILKSENRRYQKQQCFKCGKVMSSRFRLKTHLQTHTGERPFSCPHCNKKFSLAQNLKVHLRIHTGEKPLSCTICGEAFAHSAGLTVHRRKHTGQMPYQCLLCPRTFRTVGHLQYHIRRHTGAKNFECLTCGKAFITQSDLKRHSITHSSLNPHVCCFCKMRLTRAADLKRHIRFLHANEKEIHSELPTEDGESGKQKVADTMISFEKNSIKN